MKKKNVVFISIISIFILLIAIITFIMSYTNIASPAIALPISLSFAAFVISILSAFKDELFPFHLSIFMDNLHLVTGRLMPPSSGIAIAVLLPVTFSNGGYSEGIIQMVKLVVSGKNSGITHEFSPSFEVDMAAFAQQNIGISASNILGTFAGFLLEAKQTVRKNIVFIPKVEPGSSPFVWQPDLYTFEIFVQVYGEKTAKNYFELEKQIDKNILDSLITGQVKAIAFIQTNIIKRP